MTTEPSTTPEPPTAVPTQENEEEDDVVDNRKMKLGILEPYDYYGEVTGTVIMMSERPQAEKNSQDDTTNEQQVPDDGLKRTPDGIVLNPQPQNDPNDPLNWPMWRRDLALLVIGFHSFMIGGQTPILATAFTSMSKEFGVTESKLAYLVGAYMLVLGFGSVFFAPTATLYGKRFVYLVALIVWIVGSIMAGAAKSYNLLLAARIIMGFGGSPSEALPSASIAEIYFLHERAYRLGIYTLLLLGGKNLVPMIAGFIISGLDWNWLFWIQTMIVGMNLVLTFFFVPETFWERAAVPTDKRSIRETELAREARVNSLRSVESSGSKSNRNVSNNTGTPVNEGAATATEKTNDQGYFADFSNVHQDANEQEDTTTTQNKPRDSMVRHPTFQEPPEHELPHHGESSATPGRPSIYNRSEVSSTFSMQQKYLRHNLPRTISTTSANNRKKKYVETLKPYHGRLSNDKWWMVASRPFILLAYPAVLFSMFIYAFSVVWLIVISEVISSLFTPDPYNFPDTSVGLLYISTFLGGCIGSAIAGRFSDVIVRVLSRRNHGTYEPEYRLIMILPVMISVTMGMIGFGWSSFDKDAWIVPTIFLGILGFGCSLGSTTAITYSVDSYKMFASEALVTLNLAKNTIGFLFSLFVNHFLETSGPKTLFVVFGSIQIFLCLWAIPLYIYGKRLRHWTDNKNMMKYFFLRDDEEEEGTSEEEENNRNN